MLWFRDAVIHVRVLVSVRGVEWLEGWLGNRIWRGDASRFLLRYLSSVLVGQSYSFACRTAFIPT